METIKFTPQLIKTKSFRDSAVAVDGAVTMPGDEQLIGICGAAGMGKTFTSEVLAAQYGGVYVRVQYIWKKSELEFAQALCRGVGMVSPPSRKGKCWLEVIARLKGTNRPVFLDEMQRLPKDFLLLALDLTDATKCPVILVGEPELKGMMEENKRMWSRTFQFIEFEPIAVSDVMLYAADATGIGLDPGIAGILHTAAKGDFRIVKRSMRALVQFVNAKGAGKDGKPQVTEEMARIAAQAGLKGKE